jgi:hypothetical protein
MSRRSNRKLRREASRSTKPTRADVAITSVPQGECPMPKETVVTSFDATEKPKDGTSAFIALASFALAQGGALTVVAKGEGREAIVLTIYGITVAMTVVWIIVLLRSQIPGTNLLAYDSTSLRYGRFTLLWNILLAVIMVVLAYYRLLPNQTNRTAYLGRIDSDSFMLASKRDDALAMLTKDIAIRNDLQMWVAWLIDLEGQTQSVASSAAQPITQRFVWIEQRERFQSYYKDVAAKITYDRERFRMSDRVAFLVGPGDDSLHPRYRPVLFRRESGMFADTLDIPAPDPNDSLIVIARVESKDGGAVTDDVKQFKIAVTNAK